MKRKRKQGCEGSGPTLANPRGARKAAKAAGPKLTLARNSSLQALFARGTLDERQLRAALAFREKVRAMTGGMPAMDWMREKVDGGRLFVGPSGALTGALDAERQLRAALGASGMGATAAEIVWRVAGLDEAIKAVAVDFEERQAGEGGAAYAARVAAARQGLAPSGAAQRYVSRVLKDGLARLADCWFGPARRQGQVAAMMSDWLTVRRAK
jgi:hypothetical protein